ncbi:MAG: hypothetical protein QW543_04020 [Sulfolobales archaeon]
MTANRLERLFRTNSSVKLSAYVLLADGLFSLSSEYGCETYGDVGDNEVRVYYSKCSLGQNLFELEELMERGVAVHFINGVNGNSPEKLLEEASRYALEVAGELKYYSYLTSRSRVEYSLLVMKSGDVYIAEGEVDRVSLPYVSDVILEAHTHPISCTPSGRDVVTTMVRFMEGLYASAVVGPSCVFLVYRVRPLTEEDLVAIRRLPELLERRRPWAGTMSLGRTKVLLVPY